VAHEWGAALGFDWAYRHLDALKGVAYMEINFKPHSWNEYPELGRKAFQALRSPASEHLALEENALIELNGPKGVLLSLTEEEMDAYCRLVAEPGVDQQLMLAVALLLALVGIEAHVASPPAPRRFFRNRNCSGANLASFLVGAAHIPMFYLLSLYIQQALGCDALRAGLAILPIGVVSLPVATLVVSRALNHLGARGVLAGGPLLLAQAPSPVTTRSTSYSLAW
jgi:hypothetical protein